MFKFELFFNESLNSSKYEKLSFNVFELIVKSFELSLFLFWGFFAIDSIFDFTKLELNFDI